MGFQGKTVVICAARIDAGRACALDFADKGADVFLLDKDRAVLEEICAEVRAAGGKATALPCDPCDLAALDQAAAGLDRPLHALVNCHLTVDVVSIEESTAESWRRILELNLLGPVFCAKAFLPLLKRAPGEAAIVHISSFDGILGNPQVPSYSTSKGAMIPLTHVMANEFAAHAIRVNCIARGSTAPADRPPDPRLEPLLRETPLGRSARPDEIASVARFLASADASYMTGSVVVVDGGRTSITPGTRWTQMR